MVHRFVEFKNEKHGEMTWVMLFFDNLSAHLDLEVREIFGNGKVFLCYFPPNMTNFVQTIDAGLGRSVRIRIGHALDNWLMDAHNLESWESNMTASERRILTTKFIAKAMGEVMSEENVDMRRKAFEKTGCLITWLPNDLHDEKICPQGLKKEMFMVPTMRSVTENDEGGTLPVAMELEEAGVVEEQIIIDENDDLGSVHLENEEDDGSVIDDNPEN